MSKGNKSYWSFFRDDKGRIAYNETCQRCENAGKQSFRSVIVCCPRYKPKKGGRMTSET